MKTKVLLATFLWVGCAIFAFAEGIEPVTQTQREAAPSLEFGLESAYLLSVYNTPRNYELSAEFLTARIRWGSNLNSHGFFRGYSQIYFSAEAEPILRGIENRYFAINVGGRYNLIWRGCPLVPFISGGLGLGAIDSHADIPGAQGQDFTFNILASVGVGYRISSHWRIDAALLFEHLSNGGQTDPNPSLNLVGPQIGATCSF